MLGWLRPLSHHWHQSMLASDPNPTHSLAKGAEGESGISVPPVTMAPWCTEARRGGALCRGKSLGLSPGSCCWGGPPPQPATASSSWEGWREREKRKLPRCKGPPTAFWLGGWGARPVRSAQHDCSLGTPPPPPSSQWQKARAALHGMLLTAAAMWLGVGGGVNGAPLPQGPPHNLLARELQRARADPCSRGGCLPLQLLAQ